MKIFPPALAMFAAATLMLAACEDKNEPPAPAPAPSPSGGAAPARDDHGHGAGHHGAPVELGTGAAGPYTLRAARDAGDVKAGGDAPIDAWVDPSAPGAPKVTAVRFWIGTEDAAGSIKARAEIEGEPNHWHTHAEIPDPIPAGSKLWIEIEDDAGGVHTASFDLKA